MKTTLRLLVFGALIAVGVAGAVLRPSGATSQMVGNNVLNKAVKFEEGLAASDGFRVNVSGGTVTTALEATGFLQRRAGHNAGKVPAMSSLGTQGCQNRFTGGGPGGPNIRVNQDCSLRRQAEEVVVANPTATGCIGPASAWAGRCSDCRPSGPDASVVFVLDSPAHPPESRTPAARAVR